MSTDRKIAWFGIGLSVLGLIPIFRDANIQLVIAYCLVFLGLAGFFLYATLRTSGPQFTTVLLRKTLTIQDRAGHEATLLREQTIRVNFGSVQEIWCRGIYASGNIDQFKVDGYDVPLADQITEGETIGLRKRFPEPVFGGHAKTVKWSYRACDSFSERHEALDHEVIPGTSLAELIVILPADRTCVGASVHVYAGREAVRQEADPEISDDRRTIRSVIKSPKSGHTIRLSWDW